MITLPSAGDIIASTTPYAQGFFGALLYLGLGILGFAVAGVAIVAVKRGVMYVVKKIFGAKSRRGGRRRRR